MINDMHKQGVIEESSSSWCSPVVLKRKKDDTWRFCVDFRKLNDKTIKDSYPLPRINQTLDKLAGNSWFSTLDLESGYWQVKIRPEDREKTAFSIAYRSSIHATTGVTPAEMVTGFDLRLPLDLMRGSPPTDDLFIPGTYIHKLKTTLNKIHHFARLNIGIYSQKTKKTYNRTARKVDFQDDQKVWFYNPRCIKGKTPKL
ncbi:uncharacterized protein LOC131673522 [Phymastichus coffea]|uniref:uncharacterized protein LOC131673522 n=1 Tax=Phymastichus coffea TaxID=108790 RepID=UPI00273B5132|nr:uncharacterized protein LOC131673522 [Phymastichus coffea]